jgi:hypothetical protein
MQNPRRTVSLIAPRPSNHFQKKGNGHYISESVSGFPHKVNGLSEKELKDTKFIINNIRKHNWDNGSKKGNFTTTNNEYLKYNEKGAKVANIPLTEDHKNNLRESHYEFGKGKIPLISTQFNSFLPNNNVKNIKVDSKLKNSSIEFNPNFSNIKGATRYMTDY